MNTDLPLPGPDAQQASLKLSKIIADEIVAAGGWIPFSRYMELALHHPGLGYYGGGAHKFGDSHAGGDFITAPELTPLFGQTLANQVVEIMSESSPVILEVGAGSGILAADMLAALAEIGHLPDQYLILELSGELRARQQQLIRKAVPDLAGRVAWLDSIPDRFSGCIVANELLDAMPVHAVAWRDQQIVSRGVTLVGDGQASQFTWSEQPAATDVEAAAARLPVTDRPYLSEIGLVASAWLTEWANVLQRGAMLLIDYGLPQHEYYHSARNGGTIRCHYQHRVHDDPFWWPGLCDITAHVDFSALAAVGQAAGLEVLGYCNQASFLINCGLGERLAKRSAESELRAFKAANAARTLISPNEMGELFKALAMGRGIERPLLGFSTGDRRHALLQ